MPTMVMSSFVDRVPRKAMAYLVYSMAEVSAERALSYGIVSDVVPAAKLDAHVEKLIAAMLKAPSISLQPRHIWPKPRTDTCAALGIPWSPHSQFNLWTPAPQPKPQAPRYNTRRIRAKAVSSAASSWTIARRIYRLPGFSRPSDARAV